MLFTLLGYLCLVLAFFGAIAIFVGQFQENNPIMRNIGIGIVIISLIVFGATKILGVMISSLVFLELIIVMLQIHWEE